MVEGATGEMLLQVIDSRSIDAKQVGSQILYGHLCTNMSLWSRLGMYRDAEKQFKSALKHQECVDTYLYLCKVYIRLDQPLTAIEVYKQGLEKFIGESSLLTGIARVHEVWQLWMMVFVPYGRDLTDSSLCAFQGLNDMTNAVQFYKDVLHQDNMSIEAIACIGTHYFYTDQPEIALKFYRLL